MSGTDGCQTHVDSRSRGDGGQTQKRRCWQKPSHLTDERSGFVSSAPRPTSGRGGDAGDATPTHWQGCMGSTDRQCRRKPQECHQVPHLEWWRKEKALRPGCRNPSEICERRFNSFCGSRKLKRGRECKADLRGAFALKLDADSNCAETPPRIAAHRGGTTPASTRLTRAPRRRANISISTMTTPMRTSRGSHRNASPTESATRSSTCQHLQIWKSASKRTHGSSPRESTTRSSTCQHLQIWKSASRRTHRKNLPEIIEVPAPAPVTEFVAPALVTCAAPVIEHAAADTGFKGLGLGLGR